MNFMVSVSLKQRVGQQLGESDKLFDAWGRDPLELASRGNTAGMEKSAARASAVGTELASL